jgi:hypothetical protein
MKPTTVQPTTVQLTTGTDPLDGLSRSERRRWRADSRRVAREHEAAQLAALRGLAEAGCPVTGMVTADFALGLGGPVEMIIDGRRLRAWRAYRPAVAALKDALSTIAHVPLAGVSRYGPYWVLTFKLAAEPLVILVDRLTLMPDWGGQPGCSAGTGGPLVGVAF